MPFWPATTTLLLPVPSTSAMAGEVQTVARPGTVCCHRTAGWAAEAILGVRGSAPSASTVNQVITLVVRSFGAFHEPGGIRSLSPSAALQAAATPPWTPRVITLVVRSFGAFREPGGIRSLSPSAALQAAATPRWTPRATREAVGLLSCMRWHLPVRERAAADPSKGESLDEECRQLT